MKGRQLIIILAVLLMTLWSCTNEDTTTITVNNPSDFDRDIETVEVAWSKLSDKGYKTDSIIVLNSDGEEIPSQIMYEADGSAKSLIFQVKLSANAYENFSIKEANPSVYPAKVYGLQAHNRYNDFIWENDVIAFRMYHTDLIPVDGPSGGLDIWSKRTHDLVINTWLGHMDYHNDHGQGCDFFKVGPTLGAGGIALLQDGKMIQHANYTGSKVIANGPIRLVAELSFNDITYSDKQVAITKTLTFDAGSSLNKFDVTFKTKGDDLPLVTGIVKHGEGISAQNEKEGYMMHWEPENIPNGHQGIGVVMLTPTKMGSLENHFVAYSNTKPNTPFTYYCGGCWDKAGYYTTPEAWEAYLKSFKQQLENPLVIMVN